MRELSSSRIGNALRRLAEDLVSERARVDRLERENQELRARLEALRLDEEEPKSPRSTARGSERTGPT